MCLGGSPAPIPAPPPPPPVPPPPPKKTDPKAQQAAEDEKRRRALASGTRSQTVLTAAAGLSGSGDTAKQKLGT